MYVSCVHCLRPAGHQSASGCSQWWDETLELCISTGGLLEAEKKKKLGGGEVLGRPPEKDSGEVLRSPEESVRPIGGRNTLDRKSLSAIHKPLVYDSS